jgi:hypothetical protein
MNFYISVPDLMTQKQKLYTKEISKKIFTQYMELKVWCDHYSAMQLTESTSTEAVGVSTWLSYLLNSNLILYRCPASRHTGGKTATLRAPRGRKIYNVDNL